MSTPPPAAPEAKSFKEFIPQEFHDRPYLKDFLEKMDGPETRTELFKKLDGAETLIGRKIGIPGAEAKPEEIEKFYSSLRPAKAEDYEFTLGEKADEAFVKEFRTAAHKAGLSKKQVADQVAALAPVFAARAKAQDDAQAAHDAEFEALMKETLGGTDYEKKVARVQNALKEFAPDAFKKFGGDKLEPKHLALISAAVDAIITKYVSEDDLSKMNNGGTGAAGATKEDLLKEAHTLMASEARKDFRHADHKKVNDRIAEIFADPVFKA